MMNGENENKFGINLETVYCPECNAAMPMLKVPENLHQLMWGGWTCPKCGCKMDKWGKPLKGGARE